MVVHPQLIVLCRLTTAFPGCGWEKCLSLVCVRCVYLWVKRRSTIQSFWVLSVMVLFSAARMPCHDLLLMRWLHDLDGSVHQPVMGWKDT